MTRRWTMVLLLWAPACVAESGGVHSLGTGYLEAAYARQESLADGGDSAGGAIGLRLPVGTNVFLTASAQTLDRYVNAIGEERVDEERRSIGVGVRKGRRNGESYARLVYVHITDWRGFETQQRGRGGALSVGARRVLLPYVEGAIEAGLGMVHGSERGEEMSLAGRGELAVRMTHGLSAYVAYLAEDNSFLHVGLRMNFAEAGRPRRAAVKAVKPGASPLLEAGKDVMARQPLQLQARPAFGAPEILVVPAGDTLSLLETLRNDFGNWWRVSWNGQEAWIREGWLLRSE
jgi:hypothetical protein